MPYMDVKAQDVLQQLSRRRHCNPHGLQTHSSNCLQCLSAKKTLCTGPLKIRKMACRHVECMPNIYGQVAICASYASKDQ